MYHISDICRVLGGQWLNQASPDHSIQLLLVDSRQLNDPGSTLFFALRGVRQDGHNFVKKLYEEGVRNFVLEQPLMPDSLPEANVILVDNVLTALQSLVAYHRKQFEIPVIGITGSNGKTIVKEWLYQILSGEYQVAKSPKSYNSQIGVPLSVWQLNHQTDLAVFEAGISRTGEMEKLEQIIRPTIGIMTNLGSAHAQGFANQEEKLEEKLLLFKRCQTVICCRDQTNVYQALVRKGLSLFTWSFEQKSDIQVKITAQTSKNTILQYNLSGQEGTITIPFTDQASIENALHCLSLVKLINPGDRSFDLAFEHLLPVAMRLESLEGVNGCVIINDVYNADLESLSVALAFANFQSYQREKTIILSDLLQQANDTELYQKVAMLLRQYRFKRLFAIGHQITAIRPELGEIEGHFFPDTASFIQILDQQIFSNELILIKGARAFGLERVTEMLSLKKHQTVLEVNLAALARNLKVFESQLLHPAVKIMAMVKAAAYGSGGVEIARFLESRHIDYLAVAYMDEGIELRKAGIKTPIMVLNTDVSSLHTLVQYQLEPEVFSLPQLKALGKYAGYLNQPIAIHLKLETGMNRLGFEMHEVEQLCHLLSESPSLTIRSIFSHLAASEDIGQRAFTQKQIATFQSLAEQISRRLQVRPLLHIANSNAIVFYPEAQFDMVRIGIGMYGIGMPESAHLEPVHTLKTYVSQLKYLNPGDTIGYGRRESVLKAMKMATIAVGYADGLIRKAGNRRYAVVINGRKAPIVGSICMDMTMVDVTGIDDIEVGTEVTVFGKDPTISELALAADTIPYEVFTSLSARVKRIYLYE